MNGTTANQSWHSSKKLLLIAACLLGSPAIALDKKNTSQPGDDLLVVDCRLPPQVRQLGKQTTYLSARKAIRTTARDCQIRGGEYIAYDRSSLRSSLDVWLPQAESGNPAAQTIVGEIYEKGIGGQPDFTAAARWYRMAAAQGDTRAQISLGYLYENGLGMARNSAHATEWYRRAADTDQPVELQPHISPIDQPRAQEESAELTQLRAEVQALSTDAEQMRMQLQDTRINLSAAQTRLSLTETERVELESKLQKETATRLAMAEQAPIEKTSAVAPALLIVRNELEQRKREIAELTLLLADTQAELAARRTEVSSQNTQIQQQTAALEDTARQQQELQLLKDELANSEAERVL